MSWDTTIYENAMESYLKNELGSTQGKALYADYESLKNEIIKDNFFNEIKGIEPNLSDHSEKHIMDVQNRAFKIIGDFKEQNLSAMDVYCLALMILFHDVGNIFGRDGHDSIPKIAEVYNHYKALYEKYGEERSVITTGASAHSGKSRVGCRDTLKYVTKNSIKDEEINLPELAAILRFADELAEGKHRTCSFLIEKDLYAENSKIFHEYAKITEIRIDKLGNRIVITNTINIPEDFSSNEKEQKKLEKLIQFSLFRAIKLDQERRYTKYYSNAIKPFKYVTLLYKFEKNFTPLELDIEPITFEDKYPIPGIDFIKDPNCIDEEMLKNNTNFNIQKILKILKEEK
jgi:hypothetical protein